MPTPGATRSGFAARSIAVGPRELKSAMVSSLAIGRSHVARRADRQHPRRVAGCGDRSVLRPSVGPPARVAGRCDDDDARARPRAAPPRARKSVVYDSETRRRDRQVDHADVELLLVLR